MEVITVRAPHLHNRYLLFGTAFIAVLLIAFVSYGYYRWFSERPLEDMAVAIGEGPMRFLYAVDPEAQAMERMSFPGEGENLYFPVSEADADGRTYYLLAESGRLGTNLFSRGRDGSLARITDSDTLKHDLSYDAESGAFAYTLWNGRSIGELARGGTSIALLNSAGEEEVIGAGSMPALLKDGAYLIYTNENILIAYDTRTKARTRLMTFDAPTLWAIDQHSDELAVYNAATGAIDLYRIRDGAVVPNGGSIRVSKAPGTLAYVKGNLIIGSSFEYEGARAYAFEEAGTDHAVGIRLTQDFPQGSLITIHTNHD